MTKDFAMIDCARISRALFAFVVIIISLLIHSSSDSWIQFYFLLILFYFTYIWSTRFGYIFDYYFQCALCTYFQCTSVLPNRMHSFYMFGAPGMRNSSPSFQLHLFTVSPTSKPSRDRMVSTPVRFVIQFWVVVQVGVHAAFCHSLAVGRLTFFTRGMWTPSWGLGDREQSFSSGWM